MRLTARLASLVLALGTAALLSACGGGAEVEIGGGGGGGGGGGHTQYPQPNPNPNPSTLADQTTFKELGTCDTVNCGRGYYQTQTNVRVSKVFTLTPTSVVSLPSNQSVTFAP